MFIWIEYLTLGLARYDRTYVNLSERLLVKPQGPYRELCTEPVGCKTDQHWRVSVPRVWDGNDITYNLCTLYKIYLYLMNDIARYDTPYMCTIYIVRFCLHVLMLMLTRQSTHIIRNISLGRHLRYPDLSRPQTYFQNAQHHLQI